MDLYLGGEWYISYLCYFISVIKDVLGVNTRPHTHTHTHTPITHTCSHQCFVLSKLLCSKLRLFLFYSGFISTSASYFWFCLGGFAEYLTFLNVMNLILALSGLIIFRGNNVVVVSPIRGLRTLDILFVTFSMGSSWTVPLTGDGRLLCNLFNVHKGYELSCLLPLLSILVIGIKLRFRCILHV